MAVHGFATHASRNRRLATLFFATYGGAFFTFTLLILSPLPVFYGDSSHSLFLDPLSYVGNYWPIALAVPVGTFAWNRYTFASEMHEMLAIKRVDSQSERRFAGIAEAQAILQGLRMPRLGVIETSALNALTVGAIGPKPMIVITRGLLDALDDDEIAALLAHEIAHWRLGDTRLLTINQVLLRTAIALQAVNPLKIERQAHHKTQWHLVGGILIPAFLVMLFVGGLCTMTLWRLARFANRKVRTGRDMIADGEAIRMTHFPEALESAIVKCSGRGWFENAERFEAMLFEGATVSQGGTHPEHHERVSILREHARELYGANRVHADSRPANLSTKGQIGLGRGGLAALVPGFGAANASRPEPEKWTVARGLSFWTDPEAHKKWRRNELDWYSWRAEDGRDWFGVARDMRAWAYGSLALGLIAAIAVSPTFTDYISNISGRTFLLQADEHFADLKCSFTSTVQECEARHTEPL